MGTFLKSIITSCIGLVSFEERGCKYAWRAVFAYEIDNCKSTVYERYEPVNGWCCVDHSLLAAIAPRRGAMHASRALPSSPTMHALVNSQHRAYDMRDALREVTCLSGIRIGISRITLKVKLDLKNHSFHTHTHIRSHRK